MPRGAKAKGEVALVAPTLHQARCCAPSVAKRLKRRTLRPFSLEGFLASAEAPDRIVLCPAGKAVAKDLVFLRKARERALWTAPEADLDAAIAGLLGYPMAGAARKPSSRGRADLKTALLLEGIVTPARARAATTSQIRHWIVENVRRVRLKGKELEKLRRQGIRWSVLQPVRVVAVLASFDLARARARWKSLLPARTLIWVVKR